MQSRSRVSHVENQNTAVVQDSWWWFAGHYFELVSHPPQTANTYGAAETLSNGSACLHIRTAVVGVDHLKLPRHRDESERRHHPEKFLLA